MLDERHANRSAIRARLYTLFLDRKRLFEKAACAKSYNKVRYVKLLGFFDHTAAGEGDILSSIEFGRRVLTWASIVVFFSLLGTDSILVALQSIVWTTRLVARASAIHLRQNPLRRLSR